MVDFDIDSIFPNFTFFVMMLAPFIIVLTFVFVALSRWLGWRVRKIPVGKVERYLGYVPVLYLFFPIYEIGQYLWGMRDSIVDRLFTYHFPIIVYLILFVGIGQVLALLFRVELERRGR